MSNTVIALKKSATPSATPGSLANGEIAINYADGILYYKAANGAIASISSGSAAFGTVNAAGTLLIADTINDVLDIRSGNNIEITGDAINDRLTITANLALAYDRANEAWILANTANSKTSSGGASVTVSNTAPGSPVGGDLWYNSDNGGLFVYYIDSNSSQWVETTGAAVYSGSIYDVANGAFDKANNALANSTGTFAGNLTVAGSITPGAWTAGQVIKDTMLSNSELTVSTTTVATSTSDTDFVSYSYTPVSNSSYLIIHMHVASYDAAADVGSGVDSYFSRIKVDGNEITYSKQYTRDTYTFRTGVLFPLTGRYTNSSTSAKSITVGVRRDSADDSITITNSQTALWMRITEIAR